MPSFFIPLSGLQANSDALSVTANNLANLNTIGYKAQRPLFEDLFYQQVGTSGDGDPEQIGVGASVQAIDSQFTQGSIQSTGVPTDVAIQGSGYFELDNNGEQLYTRAGDFSISADGHLLSKDGASVLGYPAVNGVVNPNATAGPLQIATGQTNPPNPTANVQLAMNLNSDTAVGGTFSTSVAVYDSLGGSHILTYNFTKTAANNWTYAITIPAADVGATGNPVTIDTGTLTFNGAGQLTAPAANVTGVTAAALADGANDLTFNWNLYDANGAGVVSQVSGPSAVSTTSQDGYSSGTLVSYIISSDGTIQGTFSNGQTSALGQIALASFQNDQGLVRNGSNEFLASLASGQANIGAPGTGGRGTLSGGALEQSNVDIATQFAQLILQERGYQANAKAVTTFDEVTQTAINLKQ
ncbi:MAG TPA: flagellar hook protein FlgE [Candidatus Acidoferrum sp.]|nr:flagellar hook protein FlgE [Candidatus Acidoferrum sp.]